MNKDKIKDFIENFKNRNGKENRLGIEEFYERRLLLVC